MHQLRRNCVLLILTGSYIVIHTYHAVISTVPHDNYSIYIYRSKFTEGMKVKIQFFIEESKSYDWFEGIVQYYDKHTRKYAVYFSSDDETLFVDSDESDIEIVE